MRTKIGFARDVCCCEADPESSAKELLRLQVGDRLGREENAHHRPRHRNAKHAGILRMLNRSALSRRELATSLGMHASRLVGIVDEIESLGLVVREGHPQDRRTYSLQITPKGREMLAEIARIARQHNDALCAALSVEERETLAGLLQRIADQQSLTRGVHPGCSGLGASPSPAHPSE